MSTALNNHYIRSRVPGTVAISDDEMRRFAPSIFASQPIEGVSERYSFLPTSSILNGMRENGWVPVRAQEQSIRTEARRGFQKHVVRFARVEHLQNDFLSLEPCRYSSFVPIIPKMSTATEWMREYVWPEIQAMMLNDANFRLVLTARQLTQTFNGPTAKLIQDGYLTYQMVAIRRVCDNDRKVISLRRTLMEAEREKTNFKPDINKLLDSSGDYEQAMRSFPVR